MELLLELVLEIVVQAAAELILELGGESLATAFSKRKERSLPLALLGWTFIGAACGGLSALMVSDRLIPWQGPPGVSLALSPLLCGILMKWIGDRRRGKGKATTALATFWGGSLFAFGFALVRFLVTY